MKKKKLFQSVILSVILCLILSGCRHTDPVPDPDEIIFVLSLDSDDDIYAIAVEYWADEVFCGGMAASHADGSVYKRNEQSYFVFSRNDHPFAPWRLAASARSWAANTWRAHVSQGRAVVDADAAAIRSIWGPPCLVRSWPYRYYTLSPQA